MSFTSLRVNRSALNNLSVAAFLLLVLFLPNTDALARYYFAAVLFAIPLFLSSTKKLYFDYLVVSGIVVLVLFTVFTILRFAVVVDPNLRDYTEFARLLLPVLMLIFRDKFKDVSTRMLFVVFAIYAGTDFFISLLDFLNIDFAGIVATVKPIYVSAGLHRNVDYRICGLSPGPAQHGIKMLVLYTFFYCRIFQGRRIFFPIVFSLLSALPIFLTQSRTSVVAFVIVSLGIALYYMVLGRKRIKQRSFSIFSILIVGGGYIVIRFQDFFSRILELLNGIEAISSYQDRVQSYKVFFDRALEHPAFLVIGYGKNFFHTGAFDNEYILMFLVYGPIISLMIIAGILTYLIFFLFKNEKRRYEYGSMLFFLFAVGLVIAYPATFFLQTSIIPLLFVFVNLAYWENRRLKESGLALD